ncbi:hypothetical protein D3C72_1817270 [compost metagenome]
MQQPDEDEIDRDPRQVEQRHRPLAGQEPAQRVDVAAAFRRLRRRIAEARHLDHHLVGKRRQLRVEPGAEPDQDLRADDVEQALEQVEPDRQHRQRHQGGDAAAGQRPIVDLQHVEGAGQRQDVDQAGKAEEIDQDTAHAADLVLRLFLLAHDEIPFCPPA